MILGGVREQLQWGNRLPSETCPTIGCERERDARAVVTWKGMRRVESACVNHLSFYTSRALTRMVKLSGGQEAVVSLVDGVL